MSVKKYLNGNVETNVFELAVVLSPQRIVLGVEKWEMSLSGHAAARKSRQRANEWAVESERVLASYLADRGSAHVVASKVLRPALPSKAFTNSFQSRFSSV